jgi:hypothetical protein
MIPVEANFSFMGWYCTMGDWVTAVIHLSVQIFKYHVPNFLFGTNLLANWKGLSKFCALIVFHPNHPNCSAFIPSSHFQRVNGYFGKH